MIDLKNKKIISLKNDYAFINTIGDIESIEISKNEDNKGVKFINKNKKEIIVTLDGLGNIIGYKNNSIKTLPYGFLIENRSLEELSIDHCVVIEDDCLIKNKCIIIYFISLFFNFLWSIIFFGLSLYYFAFAWLIILWVMILVLTVYSFKINKMMK